MQNRITFFLIMVIVFSCHRKSVNHEGEANKYMHQTPADELVKHFESSERDAYQKPDLVLKYLGDISNKKIMDLGAGSGYFSFRLAAAGAKVIAADVDDEFQQAIRERITHDRFDKLDIELRKLPYDNPMLKSGEVDMVFIVNTYHHLEDRVNYAKKIADGLNSDGEIVIIDFFKKSQSVGPPPAHKIAMDKVLVELREAGFTNIETNTDLLEYQYLIRAKKKAK